MAMTGRCTTEVVVPSLNELAIQEDVLCPVEGCNKRFKSSACLLMHKVRHHDGLAMTSVAPGNQSSKTKKLYYCPVEDCNRSQNNKGKPFPRIGQLKQHYHTVHSTKSFVCDHCGRNFGLKDALGRHVKECGRVFTCTSCDSTFKSSNALYQHCKRSGHASVTSLKHKAPPITTPPIIIAPIIIKSVLPLPASQTDSVYQAMETSQTSFSSLDLATQTDLSCLTGQYLNYLSSECIFPDITNETHSVQTDSILLCELGTQTTTPSVDNWTQVLPRLPPQAEESHDLVLDFLGPSCSDFGTQTLETGFDINASFLDFTNVQSERKDKSSQTLTE